MDIWFKVNVTVLVLMMLVMMIDFMLYGKGDSSGPIANVGGLMILFTIFSWPAYWLSLLWA